jgi:sugar lactone lactonase YvrE
MTGTHGGNQSKAYLYLGNSYGSGSTFVVYPLHGSKPLREITRSWGVYAMAIDSWGDVYTTDGNPDSGTITAYTPGGENVLLTIYVDAAQALAFDGSGNLFAALPVGIVEFAARRTKRLRSFGGKDATDGEALAFDRSGNLYLASVKAHGSIAVYAPGKNDPFRRITDGIRTPVALSFDKSGDLFAANCPGCYAEKGRGFVSEYAPGSSKPQRVLRKGIETPDALAVGRGGLLFVANDPSLRPGVVKPGWISVFASSGTSPVRKITKGIKGVRSLTVDAEGYLYVESSWTNEQAILVFTPDGSRLVRKITDGVKSPSAVAVGK